jgi:ureidoglycolate hydrolase
LCGFLNPVNYGKTIRFLKVSGFSVSSTTLVCLNMVQTTHAEPTGHSGRSPGQSDHFSESHTIETQSFENFKNRPYFGGPYVHEGMA